MTKREVGLDYEGKIAYNLPWLRVAQGILLQALRDLDLVNTTYAEYCASVAWLRSPDGLALALALGYDVEVEKLLESRRLLLPLILALDDRGEKIPLFLQPAGFTREFDAPILN